MSGQIVQFSMNSENGARALVERSWVWRLYGGGIRIRMISDQYVWLAWSIALLIPWLAAYVALPRQRKVMLWTSLFTTPFGLTEPLFVPAYWSPPSLFDLARTTGFDIESFIFSFGIGGVGVVLCTIYGLTASLRRWLTGKGSPSSTRCMAGRWLSPSYRFRFSTRCPGTRFMRRSSPWSWAPLLRFGVGRTWRGRRGSAPPSSWRTTPCSSSGSN